MRNTKPTKIVKDHTSQPFPVYIGENEPHFEYEPCKIIDEQQMDQIYLQTNITKNKFLLPTEIYEIPIKVTRISTLSPESTRFHRTTTNMINWVLIQILVDYQPDEEEFEQYCESFRTSIKRLEKMSRINKHYNNGIFDGELSTLYVTTDASCSSPLFRCVCIDANNNLLKI